jgi:hypothetical protein
VPVPLRPGWHAGHGSRWRPRPPPGAPAAVTGGHRDRDSASSLSRLLFVVSHPLLSGFKLLNRLGQLPSRFPCCQSRPGGSEPQAESPVSLRRRSLRVRRIVSDLYVTSIFTMTMACSRPGRQTELGIMTVGTGVSFGTAQWPVPGRAQSGSGEELEKMVSRLFGSFSRTLGLSVNTSAAHTSTGNSFIQASSPLSRLFHASAACFARRVLVGTVVSDKPMKSGDSQSCPYVITSECQLNQGGYRSFHSFHLS